MMVLRCAGTALSLGLLAMIGWSGGAAADEPSGTVLAVVQLSQADGATGQRLLSLDAPVYSGDKVVTGPVGEAQIKFRDNTKLVVGPNSAMTIDAFVFSNNNTARQVSIDAVRGAFRFITGLSRKDAYSIATPTATISVRGTEFDFNVVRTDGQTELVMFGGQTRICPKTLSDGSPNTTQQDCVEARAACGMTIVPPGGDVSQLKASTQRNAIIGKDFRYIHDQTGLLADFRVNTASCGSTRVSPYSTDPQGSGGQPPKAQPPSDGEGG